MKNPRTIVLAALAVVVLLATTLGIRLATAEKARPQRPPEPKLPRNEAPAPPARVLAPKPIALAELKVPCWGCPPGDADGPIAFRTDLDLLAPLGDGPANAALWLKDFTPQVGARAEEWSAADKRRVSGPEWLGKVLPGDDPLLREAEPWADQATMSFYPDVFELHGFQTRIPNALAALTFAKSWVARAEANPDGPTALEDCRRAIRWGRLLRQEDVTLIDDLVGLASIRAGAQGIYDIARRRGDQPLALAAAIVLGEHAPQRLQTAATVTKLSATRWDGEKTRIVSDPGRLDEIIVAAKGAPERRFRGEAILQLGVVRVRGTRAQREKVDRVLDELASSKDPVIREHARSAKELNESEIGDSLPPT